MGSSGDRLHPVSPRSLTLQGPWKASATTATTQELLSLAAVDDALAGGTFGFITSYGSTPVVWPHVCNNCFSPYDMCNTSEAFAQGPLRQLMQCPSRTSRRVWSFEASAVLCGQRKTTYGLTRSFNIVGSLHRAVASAVLCGPREICANSCGVAKWLSDR